MSRIRCKLLRSPQTAPHVNPLLTLILGMHVKQQLVKKLGLTVSSVLLLLTTLLIYRFFNADFVVDQYGVELLQETVMMEYQQYQLARKDLPAFARSDMLRTASEVSFTKVQARGSAQRMVVRLQLAANDAQPPDAKMTRYFRMRYTSVTGWRILQEVDEIDYYLSLF